MSKENNDSPLGGVFAVIGVLAALAAGGSSDMEGGAILVLVIIMGVLGYSVGRFVEEVIYRVLFIVSAIIMFLVNAAVRRFVWEVISGIVG